MFGPCEELLSSDKSVARAAPRLLYALARAAQSWPGVADVDGIDQHL
ncbi:hypothetical protein [Mycobacterium sp.]